MKITVLVDNNTLIDRYFLAEPGISLLIEDDETTVMLDTGYSDIFITNAAKMGKDLTNLDYIVLSHSHLDHTWGLEPLIRYFTGMRIEGRPFKTPALVAHPGVFDSVVKGDVNEIGTLLLPGKLSKHFPLQLGKQPQRLNPKLTFLGEIPRLNDFEGQVTIGRKEGADEGDWVPDDSSLVYETEKGLIIITGCCHAGICNTVEYAKKVCGDKRVLDIIGGLHLQNPPQQQLNGTVSYLETLQPQNMHACHCTDLNSKIALSRVTNLIEVGVGLSIDY